MFPGISTGDMIIIYKTLDSILMVNKIYFRKEEAKMIKSIAFDIDGTLTDEVGFIVKDFLSEYEKRFGIKYTKGFNYEIYPPENMFDDYVEDKRWLESWKDNVWDRIMRDVPVRKWMPELTHDLHKKGIKVHIVTARYSSDDGDLKKDKDGNVVVNDSTYNASHLQCNEDLCKEWLTKNNIYFDTFHFGIQKKENQLAAIGCDILVDDSPEQALEVSDKYKVVLVDAPYNRLIRGNNIYRCSKDDFNPIVFLDNINFFNDHTETYLDNKEDVTDDIARKFIVKNGSIYFPSSKGNIVFVVPARVKNTDIESVTLDLLTNNPKKVVVFRLSLLSDLHNVSPIEALHESDDIVRAAIKKISVKYRNEINKVKDKYKDIAEFLSDKDSTDVYRFKVDVIKELLAYAESHKNKLFIIDGIEIMMLDRNDISKYNDYRCIITSCGDKDIIRLKRNMRVEDYNPFMLLEDLNDVSTQLRKWRIISGMAPKDLPIFINRQYADSDGVDNVHLLDGEKPYNPGLIESILDMNTMLIADLHLSEKDPEKTKRVIRGINSKITPESHLVIIGDLDGKKGTGSINLIKNTMDKLRTKNIYLILGNNDQYTIDEYIKCGFKSVVDMAQLKDSGMNNIILTHCGIPVRNGDINIHGHMHGSKAYWNVDWENHFDVWDMNYYPISVGDCVEIIEKGLYRAKSEIHRNY